VSALLDARHYRVLRSAKKTRLRQPGRDYHHFASEFYHSVGTDIHANGTRKQCILQVG
jgi:hypothetical protein